MNRALLRTLINLILFNLLLQGAYARQMQLSPIPANDKLPSNTVNRIFQDSDGYIWIGTPEGLCRYDAYRISSIKPAAVLRRPGSDNVTSIDESGDFLLIGTDNGLQLLNRKTYQTSPFPDKRLRDKKIRSILTDQKGDIWIGTDGPVYVYHPNFTLKKIYRAHDHESGSIPNSGVSSIYEDQAGNIWICFWNSGLYLYDKKNSSFRAFPKIGANNNPFRIFQDKRKNYWICTWGGGLFMFDPARDQDRMYTEIPVRNKRRQNEKEALFYSVLQDDNSGYIWVMSFSGITAFKYTDNGKVTETDVSRLFVQTNNIFSDLYKDKDGNLWIAAFGDGILKINFNKPRIENYNFSSIKQKYGISANFTMLFEDQQGLMWLDMDRFGLGFWNPRTGKLSLSGDIPQLSGLKSLRSVSCAAQDRQTGEVWVGSSYQPVITVFKRKSGFPEIVKTINLKQYNAETGNPVSFFRDKHHNLWIATTNGVLVKRRNKTSFVPISPVSGHVPGIAEDKKGNIWIATSWNGLYKVTSTSSADFMTMRIVHFHPIRGITDGGIRALSSDHTGNVWLATDEGKIAWYSPVKSRFYQYKEISISGKVQNLTCDRSNHIWVTTSRQIYKIDPFKSFVEYTADDGFEVSMFGKNATAESSLADKIYFGGTNGICAFSTLPSGKHEGASHKPVITDIKINNESVLESRTHENSYSPGLLTLQPDHRNLEIDFSSLNYEFPGKIRYAYKLEGIDPDWIYPPRGRRFAVYNNLGKGNYTFAIKATGPDNRWLKGHTRLRIYKEPAYYETRAAYLLYGALILALIYAGFRITSYRLKLRSDLHIARIEREKTEELAQTKISYFTGISHDFLTPLTIISCLIDDIQITTKRNLPQYEKMRSNVNRLKRLLQQILDFRKIESGNMQLKISRGDISAFIQEIGTTHFMPLAKKKEIDFSIDASFRKTDAYFDADKTDKIVFNILSNAFKYTPKGGRISLEVTEERYMLHEYAVIRVTDSGTGIPEEEQEKIFTPFYNNSNTQTETNGIGLSLTKTLVDIHQGTIEVNSKLGAGSVFIVKIPTGPESYSENDLKNATEIIREDSDPVYLPIENAYGENPHTPGTHPNKLNLLLVDDNEDLLSTIENILKEYYNVYAAKNGLEALQMVNTNEIDIIVSDVMMPGMDGLQLCRKLKGNMDTSHIPVILLTAKNSVDDRVECYNAGANGYIAKPFELKILVARINNFLTNKQHKQSGFKSSYDINISLLDQPSLDEHFLNNTIATIEKHLTETDFDVVALAGNLNMSRSTLYRKIKALVGLSPNEFIKNIRLKHACQMMMKDKSIPVSEVAFSTGFSDPRYFATCFKAEFGITPSEYQRGNDGQA